MDELRQKLAKEFAFLESTVERAAEIQEYGSFADRNPHLGRMVRCPHCGRRVRQAVGCDCSAKYVEGTEGELFSKNARRQLMRRRAAPTNQGQARAKQLHDIVLAMQEGVREVAGVRYYSPSSLVVHAAREMHVAAPEERNIPAFAEKYFLWSIKQAKRAQRKARRGRQGA